MIFGIVAIIVLVIIGLRNKEIKIIKVREFVYKKWDKYTSTRVAIYDSKTFTEEEIDKYIKYYIQGIIERKDGIIFMLKKDWNILHEMILKDYTPKEI